MPDAFGNELNFIEHGGLTLVFDVDGPMCSFVRNHTKAKPSTMSTVQLRYDGWVTLPAAALKKFGLSTGDHLEVEMTGDAIVLRRAQKASASERAAAKPIATAAPAEAMPEPVVKRGPGRPRKTPVAALPPTLKTRGRRKAASAPAAPAH
jgi:bifunctional DNA-binding transcriptional regulator/antitoxin component of YhaV-PrlF toxin-antitoxin module